MLHGIHWQAVFTGAGVLAVASHAANTIPLPENKWGRWALGVLQFALANYGKGTAAFSPLDKRA
jgi:hypothetical protein